MYKNILGKIYIYKMSKSATIYMFINILFYYKKNIYSYTKYDLYKNNRDFL